MLTAIIPVKNEQDFLPTCLKSVAFADEILVLDSGSTDSTVELAKRAGAKVITYKWQGFRYAHKLGAQKAQGDWLLYIDADERISAKLRQEIINTLQQPIASAYQIPRKNYIMGKALKHGGWYPDLVTRLIKKDGLVDWVGELHEYPKIKGTITQLHHPIYHLTHRGMDWMLQKTRNYTKLSAQILHDNNHPRVTLKNFFGSMGREFYTRAIKHSGWKDGFVGWLEIIYQTFNAFIIQVHLWELQQKKSQSKKYKQIDQKISNEL